MYIFDRVKKLSQTSSITQLNTAITVLFVTCFFIACNNAKKDVTVDKPVVQDSVALKVEKQQMEDSLAKLNAGKKKIYLTWDDGPNNGTGKVLQTVLEEKVPMSFFIVGLHTKDSPGMWKTLKANPDIELCNHSYTHGLRNHYNRFYQQPDVVVSDFNRSQDSLHYTNHIARMPGRNAWRIGDINTTDVKASKVAIDTLHANGYDIMGWDVEWTFDHHSYLPNITADNLLSQIDNLLKQNKTHTPDHIVILSHDQAFTKDTALAELRYFFQKLKNNPDYVLQFASKYPGVRK